MPKIELPFIKNIFIALVFFSSLLNAQGVESAVDEITEPDYYENNNRTERIIDFHSDISVETTGRVKVTEHITVFANGYEIKRGLVRRIPIYRKDINGKREKVDIKILSIQRDGLEESYSNKIADGNREVYIGNEDYFLPSGIYKYTITYESYGHIGFFDDFDELYWNVTGNEWSFKIEKASASIVLPDNAKAINTSCYTGVQGATAHNCSVTKLNGTIEFKTDYNLSSNEGFTVAVSFPRDIIQRPTASETFWKDYKEYIIGLILLLGVGFYYFRTWTKVGKDPEKPVVVATFNPPHDWSPAVIRYLYKRQYDNKVFTASIVGLAVKKALHISYEAKEYTLKKTQNEDKLTKDEEKVYQTLFSNKKTIEVSDKNHKIFSKVENALGDVLEEFWSIKDYHLKNLKHIVWGGLVTIFTLVLYVFITSSTEALSILMVIPFVLIGLGAIVIALKMDGCIRFFILIWGLGFTSPIIFVFSALSVSSSIFILLMLIGFVVYVYLIKAPTELGVKTIAEIEGFRMYLKTAEEHRLNMLTPPEHTSKLFEKMLPYAIALDVENEWGGKFNALLKEINYQPEWYVGSDPFVYSSFSDSLTSSFSSASIDPTSSSNSSGGSWSSGSSGGGSSGGGGGGGGGGGW